MQTTAPVTHTPGPWKSVEYVKTDSRETAIGVETEGDGRPRSEIRSLAYMAGDYYTRPGQPNREQAIAENRANARLIAAAPELLELCQTVLARLDLEAKELGEGAIFPCAAMRDDIRAAIAKATGNA